MAVVSCTLKRTGKTGRFYVDNRGGIAGEVSVEWQVITNSASDGPVTVYSGALTSSPNALPPLFSTYAIGSEVDPGLFLMSVSPTQNEAKLTQWAINGSYTNLPFGVTVGDSQGDPLVRPWKFRIEYDTISEVITQGVNLDELNPVGGNKRPVGELGPIVNTAGQEFEDTIEEPRTRQILVATKNFRELNEIYELASRYADSLNSKVFNGYAPDYCEWLGVLASDLIHEAGIEYYQGTVRIAFNQKPVILSAVNKGWKYWTTANGNKLVNAVDDDGQTVAEPIILTTTGRKPTSETAVNRQEIVRYRTRTNRKDYNLIFA